MTERKLTPEQIDDLYKFCEEQDVEYYDLQIELVDHLATAIEQKWRENPKLSYDDALWALFDEFGASGFRKITAKKEKTLRKKYQRIQWHYIREFFGWPKIVGTSLLTALSYQIIALSSNYLRFIGVVVLADILSVAFFAYFVYPQKFKVDLNVNKEFLILQHLKSRQHYFTSTGRLPASILMIFILFNRTSHLPFLDNPAFKVVIALLISLTVIFFFVIGIYVPKRIKADFINEFPQFVKS